MTQTLVRLDNCSVSENFCDRVARWTNLSRKRFRVVFFLGFTEPRRGTLQRRPEESWELPTIPLVERYPWKHFRCRRCEGGGVPYGFCPYAVYMCSMRTACVPWLWSGQTSDDDCYVNERWKMANKGDDSSPNALGPPRSIVLVKRSIGLEVCYVACLFFHSHSPSLSLSLSHSLCFSSALRFTPLLLALQKSRSLWDESSREYQKAYYRCDFSSRLSLSRGILIGRIIRINSLLRNCSSKKQVIRHVDGRFRGCSNSLGFADQIFAGVSQVMLMMFRCWLKLTRSCWSCSNFG